jgi:hypothetical protein
VTFNNEYWNWGIRTNGSKSADNNPSAHMQHFLKSPYLFSARFTTGTSVLKPNGYELSGARQRVRSNEGLGKTQFEHGPMTLNEEANLSSARKPFRDRQWLEA